MVKCTLPGKQTRTGGCSRGVVRYIGQFLSFLAAFKLLFVLVLGKYLHPVRLDAKK